MMRPPRNALSVMLAIMGAWAQFIVCASQAAARQVLLYPSAGAPSASAVGAAPITGTRGGAGAVTSSSSVSLGHAWLAVPSVSGTALMHVPPRRSGASKSAADGTMREARALAVAPTAMAAVGDRVYVISEEVPAGDWVTRRAVSSLQALPSAVGDLWYFEPDGRLREHADLPIGGRVEGFVGTLHGPVALVNGDLLLLDDRGWNPIQPPGPLLGDQWRRGVRLLTRGGEVALLTIGVGGGIDLWTAMVVTPTPDRSVWQARRRGGLGTPIHEPEANGDEPSVSDDARYEVVWSCESYATDGSLGSIDVESVPWVGEVGGVIAFVGARPDGAVLLGTITRQSSYELARVPDVGQVFGVVPMDDVARVGIVRLVRDEAVARATREQRRSFPAPDLEPPKNAPALPDATSTRPRRAPAHIEIRELSVLTGAELYSGVQRGDAPVSATEVQLLAGGLVVVMIVVLLLVLTREPGNGVFNLPHGLALSEPGRRATAGVIDAAASVLIASRLWGVPLPEILGPNRIFSGEALWVLGSAVVLGCVLGTIGEWLLGRSLGKSLMGCVVVDVRDPSGEPRSPKFWQALVRNLVKWFATPAAMLGLMESTGRHRGDSLSRTAVCIAVDEDDDEESVPER